MGENSDEQSSCNKTNALEASFGGTKTRVLSLLNANDTN